MLLVAGPLTDPEGSRGTERISFMAGRESEDDTALAVKPQVILAAPVTVAEDDEVSVLGCALHLFSDHPVKVADVLRWFPKRAFTRDGADELAAAIAETCGDELPRMEGIIRRLQAAADRDGAPYDGSATKLLLVEAITKYSGDRKASDAALEAEMADAAKVVLGAMGARVELENAIAVAERHPAAFSAHIAGAPDAPAMMARSLRRGVPQLVLKDDRRDEVHDKCLGLLSRDYFVFGGGLATIDRGGVGALSCDDLVISKATKERVAVYLSREAVFTQYRKSRSGKRALTPVAIPGWIPQWATNCGHWPGVRPLAGIVRGPFLRADGTVGGTIKGHDEPTGLWVETDGEWPGIIMEPSQAEANAARDTLMDLLREFRFADADVAKSVWLSAVLTVIGRPAFSGPSPVFCIDAPTPGSGKGLLSRLVALIATGREPAMAGLPTQDAELAKLLTSLHAERAALACFDNVTTPVGGAVMDRQATAWEWADRLLKTNTAAKFPNHLTILVNGNNLVIASDMARRVLHMRLSPEVERPEELTFERGDLAGYVLENRRRLVAAALTILRRQVIVGDAAPQPAPMASFEGWSRLVQRAVIGCGLPDPLASREVIRGKDEGTAARREFVEALAAWSPRFENSARWLWERLHKKDGNGEFVDTDDASERLRTAMEELVGLAGSHRKSEAQSLSKAFTSMDGRLFGSLRLTKGGGRTKTGACWRLDRTQPDDAGLVEPAAVIVEDYQGDDLDDCPMARRGGF